ncbi:hypothetical protein [Vagococcus humatus]|uniref:Uncharacterized protein n=1 Tax=Vagococcus humatus TaxID=1889241 RepID=A0A429Z9S1_9ENTE|nr:hypothetical protein [Vagococcus humatus]RST90416.1 hypothetical protein C7P63_04890 [Vagococcus humatus]
MLTEWLENLEETRPDMFINARCGVIQPLQLVVVLETDKGPLTMICHIPDTVIEFVLLQEKERTIFKTDYQGNLQPIDSFLSENNYSQVQVKQFYKTISDFKYD